MDLNERLKTIIKNIPLSETLVDIGTDHAYLPICAVRNKVCDKAVAVDVRKGPVNKALKNVAKYNLQDRISVRLGDGLDPVEEHECQVIAIAGMGGMQISKILSGGLYKAQKAQMIVLQPMSDQASIREWLYNNGFTIITELLVDDKDRIYNIILCHYSGINPEHSFFDCYIGDLAKFNDKMLLKRYLTRKSKLVKRIIKGKQKSRENTSCPKGDDLSRWEDVLEKLTLAQDDS